MIRDDGGMEGRRLLSSSARMDDKSIYQLVYEIVTEAMIVVSGKGVIIEANPSAEGLFGYPMDELIGMSVDELLPEALRKAHEEHRAHYLDDPQKRVMGKGLDLMARHASGRHIPVEISLNHANRSGELIVVALISDITARKRTEKRMRQVSKELEIGVARRTRDLDRAVQALKESQQIHSLIAHNFPDGSINVLDSDFKYIFAEGMEYTRFGINAGLMIGEHYLTNVEKKDHDHAGEELQRALTGQSRTFEVTRRNNSYIINLVPLKAQDGAVERLLVVEKNITEQKQAEQDMVNALTKERELNELKSRFVSMASHEFRTPLATVLSSVNLVTRYAENGNMEGVNKHVGRIRSSVQNLTSILNDFLSLEKLEQGKVECRPEEFDLCELIENVRDQIESMAKLGQQLDLKFDGSGTVSLDPQLLRNIMLNLLSNAIKYSPEHSDICLTIKLSETQVGICVSDQGMGIPEAEQQHLFERFFRAKNATNIQGTGLGLNIVHKHVTLMNGSISFDSRMGEGTTFAITLPRRLNITE